MPDGAILTILNNLYSLNKKAEEKQLAIYRRNRKRIRVKSATGRGTITYHPMDGGG